VGTLAFDAGELDKAESAFARAVECDPRHARSWNNLALARIGRGNLDAAESALKSALGIWPDYSIAYRNMARIAAARGDGRRRVAYEILATRIDAIKAEEAASQDRR
jgi:Flp pilus assembly protein TadD